MHYLRPRICPLPRRRLYNSAFPVPCTPCFLLPRFFVHSSVRQSLPLPSAVAAAVTAADIVALLFLLIARHQSDIVCRSRRYCVNKFSADKLPSSKAHALLHRTIRRNFIFDGKLGRILRVVHAARRIVTDAIAY